MSEIRRESWLRIGPFELGISRPVAGDPRAATALAPRSHDRMALAPMPADLNDPLPARRPLPSDTRPDRALLDRVASLEWGQTIDLGGGVVTPGAVDERKEVDLCGLPRSLAGKRCLDFRTRDGFWAFEMERRGAAEVVAIDDTGNGQGFELAREVLSSRVQPRVVGPYQLSPEVAGEFDVVFVGSALSDLDDPQLAIDRARSVCRGTLYMTEAFNVRLDAFGDACLAEYMPTDPAATWHMSLTTIRRMLRAAEFDPIEELARFEQPRPDGTSSWKVAIRARATAIRPGMSRMEALATLR